jgi:anti-sigma factor RsiW
MSAEEDDGQLVAYIDRQLDESARSVLEARLAVDPLLRERLARLKAGDRPFAAAFDALLDTAPVERLQAALAALDRDGRSGTAAPPPQRFRLTTGLAAAAAILLLCAGIAIGRYGLFSGEGSRDEDWRKAVAEYMSLYTPETFAGMPPPREQDVAALGAKLGVDLSLERVGLPDLQFKGAVIFAYEGAPLGQLAYVDPATGPVLFCIIRDSEGDAAMETGKRDGFSVASWARAGRGYMLIGRLPQSRTAELADQLRRRF